MPFQTVGPRPLDPENGASVIRRNVGSCLPVDTASSPLHFIVKNAMAVDKIRSIRDLYSGISDLKKGYQPRTNVVKDEKGHLVTDCHSISARCRNHFSQLSNVRGVNDVRQTELHNNRDTSV